MGIIARARNVYREVRQDVREILAEVSAEQIRSTGASGGVNDPSLEQEPPAAPSAGSPGSAGRTAAPVSHTLTDGEAAKEKLIAERDFYRRRSQEYFGLISRMEAQRNEWKSLYMRDSAGHQSAQALLQESLIADRQKLLSAIQTLNEYRKEKGEKPIDPRALDPNLPPVGIAEETAARNAADLKAVPPQIDPRLAVIEIDKSVAPPEGVVDLSHGEAG